MNSLEEVAFCELGELADGVRELQVSIYQFRRTAALGADTFQVWNAVVGGQVGVMSLIVGGEVMVNSCSSGHWL